MKRSLILPTICARADARIESAAGDLHSPLNSARFVETMNPAIQGRVDGREIDRSDRLREKTE
jgi:hypothetical protein